MLNADELGEKGQARFKEICADAKLVCNQSDRDRSGWDFIVEFPFKSVVGAPAPLESRKTPLSCHVQVKTLLDKSDTFKMRLSSAERLAKELKPSFVYVLKVNSALEFAGAYLIQILDKPLGKILRRLRKEDAAGNSTPNKKTISLWASADGIPVAPTGEGLRDALSAAGGTDLHAYAAEKAKQLAELGFEERPYTTQMTLHLGSNDDLVDMFLGLKKDVPATDLRTEYRRFGITLPLPELTGRKATITIQPSLADTCTITVRTNPLSTPAVFRGSVFFPAIPGLSADRRKILIETDLFSMTVGRTGLRVTSKKNMGARTPTTWASYWRLAFVVATGIGTIQIASDTKPVNVTMNVMERNTELEPDQCEHLVTLCEQVCSLLKVVGVMNEPEVTMETIVENGTQITSAYILTHPEAGPAPFSFATERVKIPEMPTSIELLYVDFLKLGNVTIGYYGLAHVIGTCREDKIEWKSENVTLKSITRLHSFQQYEQLKEAARKETGCTNIAARPFEQ